MTELEACTIEIELDEIIAHLEAADSLTDSTTQDYQFRLDEIREKLLAGLDECTTSQNQMKLKSIN